MSTSLKPTAITIHCSASPNGKTRTIEQIRAQHIKERGFKDIGYHVLINPDGRVDYGRPFNTVGAHVEGANLLNGGINIGICLVGTDEFTTRQWDALRNQIDFLLNKFNIPAFEIYTHNQFASAVKQGKQCPSISINRLLFWYLLKTYPDLKA